MKHLNEGLVFTNENCVGCNRCISKCRILGSNVCDLKDGKIQIKVDARNCISCGMCLSQCSHSARDYNDDSLSLLQDLSSGKKISLILDTSFFSVYKDNLEKILGKLKSLGIEKIYDASYGGEISLWAHGKYLKEHKDDPADKRQFISMTCPSVVNAFEYYHPDLIWKQIPVQSSLMCTAIYARKYLKDENDFAFLGPCISSKTEIQNIKRTYGYVKYNVTYKKFFPLLDKAADSFTESSLLDLTATGVGRLLDIPGNFAHLISLFFSKNETIEYYSGLNADVLEMLNMSLEQTENSQIPLMVELHSCVQGCIKGPGSEEQGTKYSKLYSSHLYLKNELCKVLDDCGDYEEIWQKYSCRFDNLDINDFRRKFNDRFLQHYKIPSYTYEDIFNAMLKTTPQSRKINCGSCGYNTCQEMVTAIAYGYNRKENCIHYMNDAMVKNYYTDKLTGSPNRRAFVDKLSKFLPENPDKSYIVCIGDINRLKIINDLYGTATADAVLCKISQNFKVLAGENGLYSRFNSGTFSLAIEYTAENMAILRGIKQFDCSSLNIKMPVTMRFGLYITQSPDESIEYILHCAGISMDKSISLMENTYTLYTPEFREKISEEGSITSRMQYALDNDEFKIRFQPQYKTATGELVGAETLCTWRTGEGEIIPPSVFIPIAEKNGYIRLIDRLIWRKAFIAMKNWLNEGIDPVPISINISRVNLVNDSLIYEFKHLENEFNIPKKYIHFEITESAYTGGESSIVERIGKIRDMGYQIAMDDFGSGYSSLNTLKDIPLDILKLDMGFLRAGSNMNKGGTIISSIVRMAQALELITIAEGVETKEQADFLKTVGCDIIQGYYYSRNITEEKFHEILLSDTKRGKVEKPKLLGAIDINRFYNPESAESMMFERFTGPAAVIEYDSDTRTYQMIRANEKCLCLFGVETYSFTEMKQLLDKVQKSDRSKIFAGVVDQAIKDSEEKSIVVQNMNYRNQIPIWIKYSISEISCNGSKHVIYLLLNDVSEEKLTETTLEISNSQMSLIMNSSNIGTMLLYFSVDLRRVLETVQIRVLKVNDAMTELSGYSREELLSWTEKDTLGAIHPIDRPGFLAKYVAAMAMKFSRPFSYEYKAKTNSGSYVKHKVMITGVKKINTEYLVTVNITRCDES